MNPEIRLHVEPGVVKSWDAFRRESPPCSIALDGYVDGPPDFDHDGPYANFDHHRGVNRLATRSTTGQVLVAIYLGLFESFSEGGRPLANVFVNDCDQDVCMAYWLLVNAGQVSDLRIEMTIAQLIIIEDLLDATAGAIPADPNRPTIRKQAWAFELYDAARATGDLQRMNADEMRGLIEATAERLSQIALGNGEQRDLVGEYEVLGGGPTWQMIRERGQHARTILFAQGVRAFVAVRDLEPGRYAYTIGRMSPFVDFPIERIYDALNQAENCIDPHNQWGGSDTIGGSPRSQGSRLTPQDVEAIVEGVVQGG